MSEPDVVINAQPATSGGWGMFWVVVGFFVFEYLRLQSLFPAVAPLHVPLVLSAILGMYWLAKGDKKVLGDPLIRLFIVFLALTAVSVVFALNTFLPYKNSQLLATFLFTVVLPFIAIINSEERLRRFVTIWVLIHAGLAALAIVKGGTGSGGFLEDENDLCLALDMAVPYAWFLASETDSRLMRRLFFYGVFVLLIVGIVATDSRGGFVGLAAAVGLIVLQSERPVRNGLALLLVGALTVWLFVPKTYYTEIESISDASDSTRLDRFYLWSRAVEMFEENPVLGVGSGNFPMRVSEYEVKSGDFDPLTMHLRGGRVAHSLYFTVLSEYGLAGVLVYGGMVIIIAGRLLRIIREGRPKKGAREKPGAAVGLARAMLQALAAFLVAGAFITVLVYQHFWYLIGFVIALDLVVRGNGRKPNDVSADGQTDGFARA